MNFHDSFNFKSHKISQQLCLLFVLVCVSFLFVAPAYADAVRVAVLFPSSKPRIVKLYNNIARSMQSSDVEISTRELSADESIAEVEEWLDDVQAQAVILLGKKGLQFSLSLNVSIPVITGAHTGGGINGSAVTLTAEPEQLFSQLKNLNPDIKQVHVIYNQTNNSWLIKQAKKAADAYNIKLNAIATESVSASAQALKKLTQELEGRQDAIWLPFDPILPVKPLLPDLLRVAWKKNLIVFSGNPYHVQQGVLFALFPDYSKLGHQLIDLALRKIDDNEVDRFEASRYLNSAINVRTATHLGIQLSSNQKNNYKMVFPKN